MNWKCVDNKLLCAKQKRVLSKNRLMNANIENSCVEKTPVIGNCRMSQIDLLAKDIGVHIEKLLV